VISQNNNTKGGTTKYFGWMLGIFGLVLVMLALNYWVKNRVSTNKKILLPVTVENIQDKGFIEAKGRQILDWIDSQRDERWAYHQSSSCPIGDKDCVNFIKAGVSGHLGLINMWARYEWYETFNNPIDLEVFKKDLKIYSDSNKFSGSIQNDTWNCYLVKKWLESDDFDSREKQMLDEICWNSRYFTPSEVTAKTSYKRGPWSEEENAFLRGDEIVDFSFPEKISPDEVNLELNQQDLNLGFIYPDMSSDYFVRYELRNKPEDLIKAKYFLSKSFKLFDNPEWSVDSADFDCRLVYLWDQAVSKGWVENLETYKNKLMDKVKEKSYLERCGLYLLENENEGAVVKDSVIKIIQDKVDILNKFIVGIKTPGQYNLRDVSLLLIQLTRIYEKL
jgi:hypothetical protein